ncbi:hypothetical protein ACWDTR_09505 [Streptomyces sp. NPDC003470]
MTPPGGSGTSGVFTAADLLCFGPDWDAEAEDLKRRAAELEQ